MSRQKLVPPTGAVDRAAELRVVPDMLAQARANPDTRVVLVRDDAAPFLDGRLGLVGADAVPDTAEWAFLGLDGGPLLVAALPSGAAEPFDAQWRALREAGGELPDSDADILVEAISLARWLRDAAFCPTCGGATDLENAGWSRRCRRCGREHFPRTDPAVIAAVTHPTDPDLLLLGSNVLWGENRFSCFAGFVEAGEGAEATLVRELAEEAGISATDIRYRASQAWPYPRSLMLGFYVTAEDPDAARPDGEEIVAVHWFTRAEIRAALDGTGDYWVPGPVSIAGRLIADWCAGSP